MKYISTKYPVDTIIAHENLYLGTYHHKNNIRSGEILIYKNLLSQPETISTSGTLSLSINKNIFAANSNDISIFDQKKLLKKVQTDYINTHIFANTQVFVSNSNGQINLYTHELLKIDSYKLCDTNIWSFINENDQLIAVGETEFIFFVDLRIKEIEKVKCQMICTAVKFKDLLFLGTYTDKILVYDLRKGFVSEIELKGQIWKIKFINELILIAAMHEGVYVCDMNFKVLKHFKESSMVYDVDIFENNLIYSSFYENKVYLHKF